MYVSRPNAAAGPPHGLQRASHVVAGSCRARVNSSLVRCTTASPRTMIRTELQDNCKDLINSKGFMAFAPACPVCTRYIILPRGFVAPVLAGAASQALHEGPFWAVTCCPVSLPQGNSSCLRACRQHMRTCSNATNGASRAQGLLALLPLPPINWGLNPYFMWSMCTSYHPTLMPDLLPAGHKGV